MTREDPKLHINLPAGLKSRFAQVCKSMRPRVSMSAQVAALVEMFVEQNEVESKRRNGRGGANQGEP